MPFLESSHNLRAKTHTSGTSLLSLAGIIALVCVAVGLFMVNLFDTASGVSFELAQEQSSSSASQEESSAPHEGAHSAATTEEVENSEVVVFVSGEVLTPGVYSLPASARVADAIELAGGFTENAHSSYNNLARKLVDGEQIHIPSLDEVADIPLEAQGGSPGGAGGGGSTQAGSGLININTASQSELETLPGIGPATAAKIIGDREANGPFNSVDELMRISGIGEKKYASLEGLICV